MDGQETDVHCWERSIRRKALGDYIRHRALPAGKEESMMDDTKRALLGDREAAKRLTDAGVLLPCAHCRGRAILIEGTFQAPGKYGVVCGECFCATTWCVTKEDAIGRWNTRAPILSGSEREMLDAKD